MLEKLCERVCVRIDTSKAVHKNIIHQILRSYGRIDNRFVLHNTADTKWPDKSHDDKV